MDPALRLCAHLASDALAALPVEADDVLAWRDGPIAAVVRCAACGGAGLLELLDWSADTRLRVYALAALSPAAYALYGRNAARGSCDLARRERELEALVASAGPPERLVAREAASDTVVRSRAWPADAVAPSTPWDERGSHAGDAPWLARLGLARS